MFVFVTLCESSDKAQRKYQIPVSGIKLRAHSPLGNRPELAFLQVLIELFKG